jgi:hypothetical protein
VNWPTTRPVLTAIISFFFNAAVPALATNLAASAIR